MPWAAAHRRWRCRRGESSQPPPEAGAPADTVTGQLQRILGSTVTVRDAYTLDLTQASDSANSTFVAEDGAVLDVVAPWLEANSLRAIRAGPPRRWIAKGTRVP